MTIHKFQNQFQPDLRPTLKYIWPNRSLSELKFVCLGLHAGQIDWNDFKLYLTASSGYGILQELAIKLTGNIIRCNSLNAHIIRKLFISTFLVMS